MEIREVHLEEWQKLKDLYLEILKNDPEAFADEYDEVVSRTEEDWIKILKTENGACFVAVEDGMFIGMGRVSVYTELPTTAVLHKLGVLPQYRQKGIGKELVKIREKWAKDKGFQKVRLYVTAGRKETIEF